MDKEKFIEIAVETLREAMEQQTPGEELIKLFAEGLREALKADLE